MKKQISIILTIWANRGVLIQWMIYNYLLLQL